MATNEEYTSNSIQILTDREHVRKRTGIYLGSLHPTTYNIPILDSDKFEISQIEIIPAVYKAIGEILDNSIDEFSQITLKNKKLTIQANPELGMYVIGDNGRGIPLDTKTEIINGIPKETYTPELALSRLRCGRNFSDDKASGVIGQNGVGSACTNYCSKIFEVIINRDKKTYYQKFENGADIISEPKIINTDTKAHGTSIKFQLDDTVFSNISLPNTLIRNKAIELSMSNKDIIIFYNSEEFQFNNGMFDYIKQISNDNFYKFIINSDTIQGEIFLVFGLHNNQEEQIFTWVNSSLLFDGGKCNSQILNVIFDNVTNSLEKEAKKTKTEVTRNDIRQGLTIFQNLKIKDPEYDSQSKTRLVGPDLRKNFIECIESNWKTFTKQKQEWLNSILLRANERHHNKVNKKAISEHEKKNRKKIDNLLDATSKNRKLCSVLITEGLSAKSSICESRDPEFVGAYALTGKINNTYGSSIAQVLQMGKLTELLIVLGLTPGKKATVDNINFSKIIIASDADTDGGDIFTLVVCLLYGFWPELFDPTKPPIVHRLLVPNVVASKGDKRIFFPTRNQYELEKSKYSNYSIEYLKGLGSMISEDWKTILNSLDDFLIPIVDDGNMSNVLKLLFSDNADNRKVWLSNGEV